MSTGSMPPGQFHPAGPTPERGSNRAPMMLAGLALFVAIVAAGVSIVALSQASKPAAAAPASPTLTGGSTAPAANPSVDVTPTDDTETTAPSSEPTSDPTDGPDPSGVYTVAYAAEPLVLQPSGRYVDLDAPSGNSSSAVYELQYSGTAPAAKLEFNSDVALASIASPAPTANDCVQQLRRAPIDPVFTPSKGQQVCVLTSRSAADDQGTRQRVVLMKVNSITEDGTLNLTLSAWTVPR
jgi:hypothetical protein